METRKQQYLNKSNLKLVTEEYNRSKGSEGVRYHKYVGNDFTSDKAENSIENSTTLDGLPFLDAENGNPISFFE